MSKLWKLTAAACISFGLWSAFGVQNAQGVEKGYIRLSGTDRLDTAVQISRTGWPTGLKSVEKSVILARAENPVDSILAASLAGAKDAPILLTYSGSLDNNVLNEIKRLGTKKVYVLGSSGAISQNVVSTLVKQQLKVVRIDGADKFDMAKKINEVSGASSNTTAIVVNGNTIVDALSATSEASINKIPIYLSTTSRLPISLPKTIRKVIIYGSTGVVNANIESKLRAEGKIVTRINGADRYDTNVKALKASNISFKHTILVRGISVKDNIEDYPDAVVAGGLAHKLHARIVLTHPTIAIPTVKDYLATDTLKTYVLGATGTLTDNVLSSLGYKVPLSKGPKYIQALTDTALYDNRTGQLDEFAVLLKGQALEVVKELNKDFWQVKWANTYAYVPKNKVKETTQQLFKNSNTSYKSTSKKIIPIRDGIQVKDGVTNKPFASLKVNHRYPVIAKKNNSWLIDIGGRYGYVDSLQVKEDKGIPILMYHHVLDEKELGKNKNNSATVTTEAFTQEMNYLSKQGFTTVTTNDIEKYVKDKINLPAKTVAITFDDGLLSVRDNAYPVLKQYGMKATEYVITSRNNHPTEKFDGLGSNLQFFSKEDMANMKDIFDYQAHTNALHNLNSQRQSDVITKPYATVKEDIQLNKKILNAHSFAYPFGQYNQQTMGILKEVGFTSAVTTRSGYINTGDDVYQLNRMLIDQHTTLSKFSSIVQ